MIQDGIHRIYQEIGKNKKWWQLDAVEGRLYIDASNKRFMYLVYKDDEQKAVHNLTLDRMENPYQFFNKGELKRHENNSNIQNRHRGEM